MPAAPDDPLDTRVLARVGVSRRDLVRRLVTGTAFAVPVVASFDMSTLTVSSADAASPNQGSPVLTSGSAATFTVGTPGSFLITTSGTPSPSIEESGALPLGVTFTDNGDGTATLSGTPAPGDGGSYPLTISASNADTTSAVQSLTLTVEAAPAITSAASATFAAGEALSFTVTSTGFPTPEVSESGALPGGVDFDASATDGTALISGTASRSESGDYDLTLEASNGIGAPTTQAFVLSVDAPPEITSVAEATFTVGQTASFTILSDGSPAPTLQVSGALPPGLTVAENGATATLAGTPAVNSTGSYTLAVTAISVVSPDAAQELDLTVVPGPPPVAPTPPASEIESIPPGFGPPNEFTLRALKATDRGIVSFDIVLPGAGLVEMQLGAADDRRGDSVGADMAYLPVSESREFVFGHAQHVAAAGGTIRLSVSPDAAGRRLLRNADVPVRLWLTVAFTPKGGYTRARRISNIRIPRR